MLSYARQEHSCQTFETFANVLKGCCIWKHPIDHGRCVRINCSRTVRSTCHDKNLENRWMKRVMLFTWRLPSDIEVQAWALLAFGSAGSSSTKPWTLYLHQNYLVDILPENILKDLNLPRVLTGYFLVHFGTLRYFYLLSLALFTKCSLEIVIGQWPRQCLKMTSFNDLVTKLCFPPPVRT